MEIIAKENKVTIMDHETGSLTKEFVEDPMVISKRISEHWKPQLINELPGTFVVRIYLYLIVRGKRFEPIEENNQYFFYFCNTESDFYLVLLSTKQDTDTTCVLNRTHIARVPSSVIDY